MAVLDELQELLARLQVSLASAQVEREFRLKSIDTLRKMLEVRQENLQFLRRTKNTIILPEYHMLKAEMELCTRTIKTCKIAVGQLDYTIRERRRQVAQVKQSVKQATKEARKLRMKDVNNQ